MNQNLERITEPHNKHRVQMVAQLLVQVPGYPGMERFPHFLRYLLPLLPCDVLHASVLRVPPPGRGPNVNHALLVDHVRAVRDSSALSKYIPESETICTCIHSR